MRFTLIQYSNQFALGGWSWTVLTYRVQRKVLTSDLGRSYLLPTRANIAMSWAWKAHQIHQYLTVRLILSRLRLFCPDPRSSRAT